LVKKSFKKDFRIIFLREKTGFKRNYLKRQGRAWPGFRVVPDKRRVRFGKGKVAVQLGLHKGNGPWCSGDGGSGDKTGKEK
jgi:hypothetical protein